jgi:hypothetical protein
MTVSELFDEWLTHSGRVRDIDFSAEDMLAFSKYVETHRKLVRCPHAFVQLSGEPEIYCSKCAERRSARGSNVT